MGERKFNEHLLICLGQVVGAVIYCFYSGAFTGNVFLTCLFFFSPISLEREKRRE